MNYKNNEKEKGSVIDTGQKKPRFQRKSTYQSTEDMWEIMHLMGQAKFSPPRPADGQGVLGQFWEVE